MNKDEKIESSIQAIEAEMKAIGLWQEEELPESCYEVQEAFGADRMSLAQWLQFVLIPRVKQLLQDGGPWPQESQVGIYAAQQYLFFRKLDDSDTYSTQGSLDHKEAKLVGLLQEFDKIFA